MFGYRSLVECEDDGARSFVRTRTVAPRATDQSLSEDLVIVADTPDRHFHGNVVSKRRALDRVRASGRLSIAKFPDDQGNQAQRNLVRRAPITGFLEKCYGNVQVGSFSLFYGLDPKLTDLYGSAENVWNCTIGASTAIVDIHSIANRGSKTYELMGSPEKTEGLDSTLVLTGFLSCAADSDVVFAELDDDVEQDLFAQVERARRIPVVGHEIGARLLELIELSREESGPLPSIASYSTFVDLMSASSLLTPYGISLDSEGQLSVRWRHSRDEYIALRFHEDRLISYSISRAKRGFRTANLISMGMTDSAELLHLLASSNLVWAKRPAI
jgi:hypothetical protein